MKMKEKDMESAENYDQWAKAAIRHDKKHRLDHWKVTDESAHYDYVAIRDRLERLRELRAKSDSHGLLFALNEGIHGNMGGMGRPALYRKAKFATKQLIIDYVEEVAATLKYLASGRVRKIHLDEKVEFFQRASHCFGRSALLMSGAGTLLYFHLGVVKALWEQGLLPRIISGSSGGALVAALVGTHSDDELRKFFDPEFLAQEIEQEAGLMSYFSLRSQKQVPVGEMYELIAHMLPDLTFQEAQERTGLHINIPVAPAEIHQGSRLLNATTSPNVMIREAVLASCAVPGVYPAVTLAAKNEKGQKQSYLPSRRWIDGSVAEDLPIKRLSRLYGVNHTIVSQTNPLVLPFVNANKQQHSMWDILQHAGIMTTKEWALAAVRLVQKPAKHSPFVSKLLNTYSSIISQTYTGDINILPPTRTYNPTRLLSYRTKEEIIELIRNGERSTWPKIEMIRTQTKIGRTLDEILENYEESIVMNAQEHEGEILQLAGK
jgi:NTE family protein